MIVYSHVSEDQRTIFYKNVSNNIIPVDIKVYESYTDALIYEGKMEMVPMIDYYTYTHPSWKNKIIKIYSSDTGELLLPMVISGTFSLDQIDRDRYIKKICELEQEQKKRAAIVEICREHFHDRKYKNYCDVENGDVVVDIGFNYGIFSLGALYNGASKIYGFEPNKHVYNLIKDNFPHQNKVFLYDVAIGGKNQKILFKPSEHTLSSSILDEVTDGIDQAYEVQCFNIYDFFKFHNINKIDLLKIDCEGAEYQIFDALPDDYFYNIKKIHVEFHFNDGIKVLPLIEKLEKNNFEWRYEDGVNQYSDIGLIFAKKKINPKLISNKKILLNDFYWVVSFSKNYEKLFHNLLSSIKKFSNRKCLILSINYLYALPNEFISDEQFIINQIQIPIGKQDSYGKDFNIMCGKPNVLLEAINLFPKQNFVYIDTDIYLTVNSDDIYKFFDNLSNYPLSNSHIHDVIYLSNIVPEEKWTSTLQILLDQLNIKMPPVYARRKCNIIVFNQECKWFFKEQVNIHESLKNNTTPGLFGIHDEDSFNALLTKYQFINSLPLIDIEEVNDIKMEIFHNYSYHMTPISPNVVLPKNKNEVLFFHGIKSQQHFDEINKNYDKSVIAINEFDLFYQGKSLIFKKNNLYINNRNLSITNLKIFDNKNQLISSLNQQILHDEFVFTLDQTLIENENYTIKVYDTNNGDCIYKNIIKI